MTPVQVAGELHFATLRPGGNHTCALTRSGAAYCWGGNYAGQLGLAGGSQQQKLTPTPVETALRFVALSTGYNYSCGVACNSCGGAFDGSAYCWGENITGQLGNGSVLESITNAGIATPQRVTGGFSFTGIRGNRVHTCGLVAQAGAALCCGDNSAGELGNARTNNRLILEPNPVLVRGYAGLP